MIEIVEPAEIRKESCRSAWKQRWQIPNQYSGTTSISPEADVGVHPVDESGTPPPNAHNVSFYCDDIHGTIADLQSRGVQLKAEPTDRGYGFVTYFTMPGGIEVQLYEPKYQKATPKKPAAAKKPAAKPAAARKPRRRSQPSPPPRSQRPRPGRRSRASVSQVSPPSARALS